jgi:hypothetical protein
MVDRQGLALLKHFLGTVRELFKIHDAIFSWKATHKCYTSP